MAFRLTRSGLVAPDIEQAITRSRPFAAAAGQLPHVVLLARRNEHGTDNYVVAPGTPAAGKAASALAASLGARADSCDLPELTTTALAVVDATPSPHPSRITQAGADPTELAALFARAARPGQWVAVALRKPTRSELARSRQWWEQRLEGAQTHYHLDPAVMVAAVYAGGDDGHELRGLVEQIMATVPGLDVETRVHLVGCQGPAAVGLGALGVGAGWATGVEWHHTTLAVLIGLVCAALGAGVGTGAIKGRGARLASHMARLGAAAIAAPPKRLSPPRRPGQRKQKDGSVRPVPGAYPLARRVLLVSPAMVIGLTSPQAGQESDVAATTMRHAPAALSAATGPMIGWAGPQDSPVHLDAAHFYGGTAVTGQPGSGKAQPLSARLPVPVSGRFPTGWATIGDLQVGDLVYSVDGSHTRVVALSEIFDGDVLEISFDDGQVVQADAGHMWSVSREAGRLAHSETSKHGIAHLARSAQVQEQADRLRSLAAAMMEGTFLSLAEMARMTGLSSDGVYQFVKRHGVTCTTGPSVIRAGGKRTEPRWALAWDRSGALSALWHKAGDKRSVFSREKIEEARRSCNDMWVTSRELAMELGVPVFDVSQTLGHTDLQRKSVLVTSEMTTRATTRSVVLVCASELLVEYARALDDRSVVQPLEQVMTTAEISDAVSSGLAKRLAVRLAEPIQADERAQLPVPPYVLGAWLGDGSSRTGVITVGVDDLEETERLLQEEWPYIRRSPVLGHYKLTLHQPVPGRCIRGHDPRARYESGSCRECMHGEATDPWNVGLGHLLKNIGVLRNKHIPASYLRASQPQRLALLQGLMDTDGTISKVGSCELTLCNERLAHDALELLRSLGIKAGTSSSPAAITEPDPDRFGYKRRRVVGTRWRIHFTTDKPVFRLARKAERVQGTVRETQRRLYITDVRRSGKEQVRCIQVAHPSQLYLTAGFVPTHNSSLLHSLWGWHCLERARPSGKPGRPGRSDTLVVIEPKPDGVPVWLSYAAAAGDEVTVVSLADPSTPAIDLFASPGTDEQRAGAFVEAMVYAWPAGDIQGRSYESLSSVLEAALAFEGELGSAWADVGLPGGADVVRAAHCLLGGFDDGSAVALVHRLAQSLAGTTDPRAAALRKLGPLFGPTVTPSQRRTATESARNKTKVLVEAGSWWSPGRPKVTWDELLTSHRAVMLATGPTPSSPVSAKLTDHISAMAVFALQGAIVRCCAGWQAEGRSVSIFIDELATVARSSSEVVSWLRAQGRSYGVRTFLATQYAEQLAEDVRNALLSSETLIVYRQGAAMAQRIAAQVATRGEGWSAADLTGLEQHTAVVLTVAQGQPQPPVPVRTAYWDSDPKRLAVDQGYSSGAAGPVAGDSSSGASSSGDSAPDDNDWLAAFRGGG